MGIFRPVAVLVRGRSRSPALARPTTTAAVAEPPVLAVAKAAARASAAPATSGRAAAAPSAPVLAARRDAPVVRPRLERAVRPSDRLGDAERASILDRYEADMYSSTSRGTVNSLWTTWCFYHERWFEGTRPVLPLDATKIHAVMAQLKEQGYASAANYLAAAKDRHLCEEWQWSEVLDRTARKATRSCTRGAGGPKQDMELDVVAVKSLGLPAASPVAGGPLGLCMLVQVGTFFVLREIESSLILASTVVVDDVARTVTIPLPAHKTDPKAVGCSRTWGCVCKGGDEPCAYHAVAAQLALLRSHFGVVQLPEDLPLFPTAEGRTVAKAKIVEAYEYLAGRLSLPLRDQHGRRNFGGHSLRVGGARHLFRRGVPISTIKLLARWGSSIIEHYLSDVPLGSLTEEYRVGRQASLPASSASGAVAGPRRLGDDALARLSDLAASFERQNQELERIRAECDRLRSATSWPPYVLNVASGCYHHSGGYGLLPALGGAMRTPCGWSYTAATARAVQAVPSSVGPSKLCSRCLPHLRLAEAGAPSDSDSSS